MGKATQDLRKEHDAILYVLKILDKMIHSESNEPETQLRYYGEVVYFLKIFADKCHHGKEENYLFPELVNKGVANESGPVGEMLREHALGREYIAQMSQSFDEKDIQRFAIAASLYGDLLIKHIDKENNVLFILADKLIDEEEQNLMFEKFEKHEENVVGHGVHEKLHGMIETWAKDFNVE